MELGYEGLRVIPRSEWGALPPKAPLPPLNGPQGMFYTKLCRTPWCRDDQGCRAVLKDLQRTQQENGFKDLMYNFIIGGDGNVYEGAGWNHNVQDPERIEVSLLPKIIFGMLGRPTELRYFRRMVRTQERFIVYCAENKLIQMGNKFPYVNITK